MSLLRQRKLIRLVRQLRSGFAREDIYFGLLHQWRKDSGVPSSRCEDLRYFGSLVSGADERNGLNVAGEFAGAASPLTIKDVEITFESLIDDDRRRKHGSVYTPDFIIDYLIRQGLGFGASGITPSVCDPACGSGGFLVRAIEFLSDGSLRTAERLLAEQLVGIDNDPGALQHAGSLLELVLLEKGARRVDSEFQLFEADTLLDEPSALQKLAPHGNGFDLVATNPPYVKLQTLEPNYRTRLVDRYGPYCKGSFSLALLFIVAAHRLLAAEGVAALITQNNLFTSLAGPEVRKYLQDSEALLRIVDFGDQKVFDQASAYTCLMFLSASPREVFEFAVVREKLSAESLATVRLSPIAVKSLSPGKWRLATKEQLEALVAIESTGQPLGQVAPIRVGFATLKDSVYLVSGKAGHCIAEDPSGQQHIIETAITLPAVKVADIQDETGLRNNLRRIIFPYRERDGKLKIIEESELRDEFPKTYAYLLTCRDELRSRDKGKPTDLPWYAWGRSQGMRAPGPKLLTKTFNSHPNFVMDRTDQLFCNGYGVFPPNSLFASVRLEQLGLLLNSLTMHYYSILTSFQIEGGYQCYQKNFIEHFGVPHLTPTQLADLERFEGLEREEFIAALYSIDLEHILELVPTPPRARPLRDVVERALV